MALSVSSGLLDVGNMLEWGVGGRELLGKLLFPHKMEKVQLIQPLLLSLFSCLEHG